MRRLLIRPGAIGDVILFLPTLQQAATEYTEVWAPRPVLPLIRFANKTRAIADTGLDLLGVRENARVQDLETFDSIYSWYGSKHDEFRVAVRNLPFTFFPALPPPRDGIPTIQVPKTATANFAIIHPFASSPVKRWSMQNFLDVATILNTTTSVKWTAGPEEELDNAVRFDDLYQLACWLAQARVYIGNDSGIAHLAAAVGTPVVSIFLTTDPSIWAPRGAHVRVLQRPTVDEVCAAVRKLLG